MVKNRIVEVEKRELPEVKTDKKFDLGEFLSLAKKVKAITDKEKKDGFLVNENAGYTKFSY